MLIDNILSSTVLSCTTNTHQSVCIITIRVSTFSSTKFYIPTLCVKLCTVFIIIIFIRASETVQCDDESAIDITEYWP